MEINPFKQKIGSIILKSLFYKPTLEDKNKLLKTMVFQKSIQKMFPWKNHGDYNLNLETITAELSKHALSKITF